MPENVIFIIADGGGAKEGAIQWLKYVCLRNKYADNNKSVTMMTISDFVIWENKTFR